MHFTYEWYASLLSVLVKKGYCFTDYLNWKAFRKSVILRHDIDYDISKAVDFARVEAEMNVRSTYFVLLTSDFYNVFSHKNIDLLKTISKMGHTIGLHFDEMNYPYIVGNRQEIIMKILQEAQTLEDVLKTPIKSVSMHRPSKEILEANLEIPGLVNSYSEVFFRDFKYISDSRRRWREPVEDIIKSGKFDKLHILTHAFWYHDEEISLKDTLNKYISEAEKDRYKILSDNFTDLDEALGG